MFLPWIMLSAALQLQSGNQTLPPLSPVPITITPDNVDLDGAGTFAFEPDPRVFHIDPPAGPDGLSFTDRLWFDVTGEPIACDVGQSPVAHVAQTGCAQLMRSATFRILPGMVAPFRRGFIDVRFSFFKEASSRAPGRKMYAFDEPGYRNVLLAYPPDQVPVADQLRQTDTNLTISIGPDAYPPVAMRYSLESTSAMQLGISRDGVIKSCRPISASGLRTAFLDNYSCRLFMKRGHIAFSSRVPVYDGLRYLNKTMRWKLPDE